MEIGKLEQVPLRQLWSHEERGFSAWLEANLGLLSEAIGVALSDPRREVPAGKFEVDLVAVGGSGEIVVVENQLEQTNHDHLGKLVTYVSNLEAKVAVWVVKDARPEHLRAVQWLNELTPDDVSFYLVKLSAFRIGSSSPAPLLSVIVGPSDESKDFGRQKKEFAQRHSDRYEFWKDLLSLARSKGVMTHSARSPSRDHWLGAGAGVRSGVAFNYLAWMDSVAVELYIDTPDVEENKRIFDKLHQHAFELEASLGASLEWSRLEEKRASRIILNLEGPGLKAGREAWPDIQARLVDAMGRFEKAFRPHLLKL